MTFSVKDTIADLFVSSIFYFYLLAIMMLIMLIYMSEYAYVLEYRVSFYDFILYRLSHGVYLIICYACVIMTPFCIISLYQV